MSRLYLKTLFNRNPMSMSQINVCKDISIAYHSLLFLLLLIESQCLLLCLCLLFVSFVCFPLIMFFISSVAVNVSEQGKYMV